MPDKDHMDWPDRPRIQKAFDALVDGDKQRLFYALNDTLTPEQKAKLFDWLCPPPTDAEVRAQLESAKAALVAVGVDTSAVDAKLAELPIPVEDNATTDGG